MNAVFELKVNSVHGFRSSVKDFLLHQVWPIVGINSVCTHSFSFGFLGGGGEAG